MHHWVGGGVEADVFYRCLTYATKREKDELANFLQDILPSQTEPLQADVNHAFCS